MIPTFVTKYWNPAQFPSPSKVGSTLNTSPITYPLPLVEIFVTEEIEVSLVWIVYWASLVGADGEDNPKLSPSKLNTSLRLYPVPWSVIVAETICPPET